jgi:hypothetical protein
VTRPDPLHTRVPWTPTGRPGSNRAAVGGETSEGVGALWPRGGLRRCRQAAVSARNGQAGGRGAPAASAAGSSLGRVCWPWLGAARFAGGGRGAIPLRNARLLRLRQPDSVRADSRADSSVPEVRSAVTRPQINRAVGIYPRGGPIVAPRRSMPGRALARLPAGPSPRAAVPRGDPVGAAWPLAPAAT